MGTNAHRFNAAVSRWMDREVPQFVSQVTQRLALEGMSRLVKRTPVDTGRLRGGWLVGIGRPSGLKGRTDKSGTGTLARARAEIRLVQPFDEVHLSNNVEYGPIVDQGGFVPTDPGPSKDRRQGRKGRILVRGGYSVQAPRGMVNITYLELLEMVPRLGAQLSKVTP